MTKGNGMSNYRNYVDDFPSRCGTVLDAFMGSAAKKDREVTLLLIAAAAGFIAPYERLKEDGRFSHPFEDNKRFKDRADKFAALLTGTVSESGLWDSHLDEWIYSGLDNAKRAPEEWPELQTPQSLTGATSAGEVIDTVRHALAHSAVLSQGNGENQIAQLLFIAENKKNTRIQGKYRFVQTTPVAFRVFLAKWFKLMTAWRMPQHEIGEALAEHAAA